MNKMPQTSNRLGIMLDDRYMRSDQPRRARPFSYLLPAIPSSIQRLSLKPTSKKTSADLTQHSPKPRTVSESRKTDQGRYWWQDPPKAHSPPSDIERSQQKLLTLTGSSVTVNSAGLANNIGMNSRIISPEDRLPSHPEPEARGRPQQLHPAQSESCLLESSREQGLFAELPAERHSIYELQGEREELIHEAPGEEVVDEPNFELLADQFVVEEFPLHFDLPAMIRRRMVPVPSGFEDDFPRVLAIKKPDNFNPRTSKSMSDPHAGFIIRSPVLIATDCAQKTDELTDTPADSTVNPQPNSRKRNGHRATVQSELLPVKKMTIKAVQKGEVVLRSLSRPVSMGHATLERADSPPRPQAAKQPFEWRRHADQDFADPATCHSRKFREKRKELNLRRKALEQAQEERRLGEERAKEAAAAAFKEEITVGHEPRVLSWFDTLSLESEAPSSSPPPSPVDLLDAPIEEEVRKSVLAPMAMASAIQAAIDAWESTNKPDLPLSPEKTDETF